ncbi:hypothetical protein [Streptomyces sp. WAC 06783]|uniref:hypothetical protein n=1 Tax=Streptomyces sp. WAC 06783 TaxID=2203211 RepID=UPI000F740C83|nr:hypothetical protein [Streptomyces sp. WAC 06783]
MTIALTFFLVRRAAVVLGTLCEVKTGIFLRLNVWAKLIHECAEVVRAPRLRDEHYSISVRHAVASVYGARAMRGTAGVSSWRRRAEMRKHALRVADALRAAEAQLDVDPREGAREIARLAMSISSRYAEGRVGALLDRDDLDRAPAAEGRFEAAQLTMTACAISGLALASPALGLPVQVTVATSVAVVALIYRNTIFTGLGAVGFLYPLFFPGK